MSEEKEVLSRQNIEKAVLGSLEQGLGGSCVSLVSFVAAELPNTNDALGGGDDGGPSLAGSCISLVSFVGSGAR